MDPKDLIDCARSAANDLRPIAHHVSIGPWARDTDNACDLLCDLADALEAAIRESGGARLALKEQWERLSVEANDELKALLSAREDRDTARAQVETLAEALRWYENLARNNSFPSADSIEIWNDRGGRARAALKAAGVEE